MKKSGHTREDISHLLSAVVLSIALLFSPSYICAETLSYTPETPTEKWVLKKIAEGETANLWEQFKDEKDRVLSASFLEKLLTCAPGEMKTHRHGIQVAGAIINEPLNLENAEILHQVRLIYCDFLKEVNFDDSHFASHLSLEWSSFSAFVSFRRTKVDGGASFEGAKFQDEWWAADFENIKAGQRCF